MKSVTVVSNTRDFPSSHTAALKSGFFGKPNLIQLTHRSSDPSSWIVRRWTKFMWFKKGISSDWFNDEQQALRFANTMKREHGGYNARLDVKEVFQNGEQL